jgi:RimJ/RimL family protein N-acetyltransferase
LLEAIIAHVKKQGQTSRLVLFTSTRSERNLRLYERFGFRRFEKNTTATGVSLVWRERV